MVTSVTFGNISNIGGKTVLTGGNSGIDSESLIKSLTEARRLPAVKLETTQKTIASETSALTELKTLLTKFQDSADILRNNPGSLNTDKNLFQYRTATVTAGGTTQSGASFLQATVTAGTVPQSHTITEVTQLAQGRKQILGSFTLSSVNDPIVRGGNDEPSTVTSPVSFFSGTVNFKGQTIDFEIDDSLQEVANKFNAVSDGTGVTASIVQTSAGKYSLVLSSRDTGLSSDFDVSDSSDWSYVTSNTHPVLDTIDLAQANLQEAKNAQFKIDGVAIERETNTISDLVTGVTLTLNQTTPAGVSLALKVEPDKETMTAGITNFLDAYNSIRLFYAKQTERGTDGAPKSVTDADGNKTVTAVLANNSTLRSVMNTLSDQVSRIVNGLGSGELNKLSDIGVTFSDYVGDETNPATKNILVLDSAKLSAALTDKFAQVQNLFEFQSSSTVPDLQVFKRTNELSVTDFTVDIDTGAQTFKATYTVGGVATTVDLVKTAITGGGYSLVGPEGSAIAGLQMVYAGTGNANGAVHVSQGIADRMYNALDQSTNTTNGTLKGELDALTEKGTRAADEITRIDEQVSTYRDQLVAKFSKLESALASINTILATLDAQAQARNANS